MCPSCSNSEYFQFVPSLALAPDGTSHEAQMPYTISETTNCLEHNTQISQFRFYLLRTEPEPTKSILPLTYAVSFDREVFKKSLGTAETGETIVKYNAYGWIFTRWVADYWNLQLIKIDSNKSHLILESHYPHMHPPPTALRPRISKVSQIYPQNQWLLAFWSTTICILPLTSAVPRLYTPSYGG